jgi:hypothetical protein
MMEYSKLPWRSVRSKKERHKDAVFLMSGDTFIGKVYGHNGEPAEENANLILDCVNRYFRKTQE